jgi:transcriptional regulator with XRE-family HTH domain
MTIGEKIRYFRLLRGYTQAELGDKLGLQADRIRQYENDVRTPKADLLKNIADSLDVDVEALSDINVQNATDIMHILFELEDKHTIDIERIGGKTAIIIDDDDMRNNILNTYLNYWYDKRQVFSLDKYSDNKDPRVIEYKSWRGRFSSHETDFENSILQNIRELYDEELKRLAKAKTKHCETVSDLIKIFCKIPPELLLDVVEVTDAGIYGFIFNADKLLDSDSFSSDFAYLLYEKDHFYNLGISGFPEIKYTGSTLKITYYTRMGGMHTVCDMVNDWLNYTRKKDSYSVLARKEYEKKFDEDLKFYSDATIKEMIELYGNG